MEPSSEKKECYYNTKPEPGSYEKRGYCVAHKGMGNNLNKAYPTGTVGLYYELTEPGMVCEKCWKKATE